MSVCKISVLQQSKTVDRGPICNILMNNMKWLSDNRPCLIAYVQLNLMITERITGGRIDDITRASLVHGYILCIDAAIAWTQAWIKVYESSNASQSVSLCSTRVLIANLLSRLKDPRVPLSVKTIIDGANEIFPCKAVWPLDCQPEQWYHESPGKFIKWNASNVLQVWNEAAEPRLNTPDDIKQPMGDTCLYLEPRDKPLTNNKGRKRVARPKSAITDDEPEFTLLYLKKGQST